MDVLQSFYSNFISFFGTNLLTQCPVLVAVFCLFLHRRKSIPNGVQMQRNFTEIFLDQKTPNGLEKHLGGASRGHNPPGHVWLPGTPRWVVPTSGASRTDSLLYKYPNIPETLGESTKYSSSRCRVQNHQIQSRHHHGGVHRPHWCLSDDA